MLFHATRPGLPGRREQGCAQKRNHLQTAVATSTVVTNMDYVGYGLGNVEGQHTMAMANGYRVHAPPSLKEQVETMTQAYKVVIEHDNQEGYVATFPELADCQAQAESLKALMKQIREALAHQPEVSERPAAPRSGEPDSEPRAEENDGKR